MPDKPPTPIRILLVEDDELFRLGLRFRLEQESDIEIVAEAADGETAVEVANRHTLDIILLDVGLPRMSGLEAFHQIKQRQPNLPILILTSRSETTLINQLIEIGAAGYCLKGVTAEMVVLAIRSVAGGASWWDRNATHEIRSAVVNRELTPSRERKISLTAREKEILTLMVEGRIDRDIAERLYIAPATVRVHIHGILHKIGVTDRSAAISIAQQEHLLDGD